MPAVRTDDEVGDCANLPVRAREELIQHSQLMQDFERGGMKRVAAEIAKEIPVLLEDDDHHAGTRHEPAQHHAGGTAARDRTLDLHDRSLPDISDLTPELWDPTL